MSMLRDFYEHYAPAMKRLMEQKDGLMDWICDHTEGYKDYARALRNCGFTDDEIEEELQGCGWGDELIQKVFKELEMGDFRPLNKALDEFEAMMNNHAGDMVEELNEQWEKEQ